MKKQVGILVFMLVAAQMSFAGRTAVESRIEFEKRVQAVEVTVRSASERGQLQQDSTVIKLVNMVKGDLAKLSKALVKQPELVKTLVFIEDVNANRSSKNELQKRAADAASDIMSVYGTAKNLTKEGQADAQAETKSVQRMAEIASSTPEMGEKAVRVLEVMADGILKGGLSANKALRKAATEVLGLKGKELETFMRDPENGLGNCKL